ncbi:hypothetical protein NE865_16592 [Phthorimaea operculella]|nr:hypothetical protein NE865_16592 [Phthorimaea operculella]
MLNCEIVNSSAGENCWTEYHAGKSCYKELVEGDVSQCLELAQDIAQAAADISRRRDGKEKPFRGKVGQGLQVPLPPVTVPVFAGDYADWPAFEDLYSSVVHTRTDITPAYKMAQLMSRLHGEPHELLTHLAVAG